MTEAVTRKRRLLELDVLRGLAAVGVMLHHFTGRFYEYVPQPGQSSPWLILRHGGHGLTLFFMISGFVIAMTLARTVRARDFVVARASRLYPAFWVAVGLTFIITHLFGLTGLTVSLPSALANLTMGGEWLGAPYVDSVYWTLSLELAFYGMMWLLFVTGWLEKLEKAVAIWLAVHFTTLLCLKMANLSVSHGLEIALLLGRAQFFIIGLVFYRIYDLGLNRVRVALLLACLGTEVVAGHRFADLAIFIGLAVVFGLVVSQRLRWIVNPPLVYLGALSYSLYLLHQNIGYVMLRGMYGIHAPVPLALLTASMSLIALAALLHHLVEKPAMNWLRDRWKAGTREPIAASVPDVAVACSSPQ